MYTLTTAAEAILAAARKPASMPAGLVDEVEGVAGGAASRTVTTLAGRTSIGTGPNAHHALSTPAEMVTTCAKSSQPRRSAALMMRPHCQGASLWAVGVLQVRLH